MWLKAERLKVNSAEPLPPASTWSRDLLPGFSRSVILSLLAVPKTLSWPRRMLALTFGFGFGFGFGFFAACLAGLAAVAPWRPPLTFCGLPREGSTRTRKETCSDEKLIRLKETCTARPACPGDTR